MNRSDCERIEPLLLPWDEGDLSWWSAVRVRHHVSGCAACREELEALRATDGLLVALTPFGPETPRRRTSPSLRLLAFPVVAVLIVLLFRTELGSRRPPVRIAHVKPAAPIAVPARTVRAAARAIPKIRRTVVRASTVRPRPARRPHRRLMAHSRPRPKRSTTRPKSVFQEVLILVAVAPEPESLYIEAHPPTEGTPL
ncbi:MAG: zf-HC2 domain-containing protein [Capsulimonadales bacterium]|nr:zf-HC2 domain-containing protein [Capsulimonadales bacterium]